MTRWTKFEVLDLAKKVLEEEKKPLSGEEIWKIAKQKGYDARVNP
jgi:hypothetical protein